MPIHTYNFSLPCKGQQEDIARHYMESIDRLVYGDWEEEDLQVVDKEMDIDPDIIVSAPMWDINSDRLWLMSSSSHDTPPIDVPAQIAQAYIREACSDHRAIVGYVVIDTTRETLYSGGCLLVTSDDIETFDGWERANNARLSLGKKKLTGFGSFKDVGPKQKKWWYSILGTQLKVYNSSKPISAAVLMKKLVKKYSLSSSNDAKIWTAHPDSNAISNNVDDL